MLVFLEQVTACRWISWCAVLTYCYACRNVKTE